MDFGMVSQTALMLRVQILNQTLTGIMVIVNVITGPGMQNSLNYLKQLDNQWVINGINGMFGNAFIAFSVHELINLLTMIENSFIGFTITTKV